MSYQKLNINISTFCVVLILFGYQLVTSIFGGSLTEDNTRMVTVPFRAFELFVLILTIALNLNNRVKSIREVKIIWIYWTLILMRCFFDIFIRTDIPHIDTNMRNTQLLLIVTNAFLPSIAIYKSYNNIDFNKLLKWCYLAIVASSYLTVFVNTSMLLQADTGWRVDANAALNTIATGQLGLSGVILSAYILVYRPLKFLSKLFVAITLIIDILIMLRAGSRGPILCFAVIVAIYVLGTTKNKILNISLLSVLSLLVLATMDYIERVIYDIAPVLYYRLFEVSSEDQLIGRDNLYDQALNAFADSPIWGKYFALYNNGGMWWCHNIILESMMQLGLIGLCLMLYMIIKSVKKAMYLISIKSTFFWIALLLIQGIMFTMTSGNFYTNEKISPLYVLLFMPIELYNSSKNLSCIPKK